MHFTQFNFMFFLIFCCFFDCIKFEFSFVFFLNDAAVFLNVVIAGHIVMHFFAVTCPISFFYCDHLVPSHFFLLVPNSKTKKLKKSLMPGSHFQKLTSTHFFYSLKEDSNLHLHAIESRDDGRNQDSPKQR